MCGGVFIFTCTSTAAPFCRMGQGGPLWGGPGQERGGSEWGGNVNRVCAECCPLGLDNGLRAPLPSLSLSPRICQNS